MKRLFRLAWVVPVAVGLAAAQTAGTLHSGCVMATEGGDYTFCEKDACSFVSGKGVDAKLAGHTVTLRGKVHEATPEVARTIVVSSIVSVGGVCKEACSPRPPGHRGFGHKDKPGSEGGTPGVRPTTPPQ